MTALARDAIFISHANPEDNDFTVWLGARLTAAGYEVWADVFKLRGGQDWQRRLEDALRNKSCKVLLVGTEHGVQKQGVRNEIQMAHTVGQSIGDAEFIIPLRLTKFDAPFLIAHAQFIDFKHSWADGLAELLTTLDDSNRVPRKRNSNSEIMDYWKQVHLRHGKSLTSMPELLVTNWLTVERLPETLYLYSLDESTSHGLAERQKKPTEWPNVRVKQGFLAFCSVHDLQDHSVPNPSLKIIDQISTNAFLRDAWLDQHIKHSDAHNHVVNLMRQAMELTLSRRMLSSYDMVGGQAWWGDLDSVPSQQIAFSWGSGLTGRRQIIGYSKTRRLHWHYGITPKPRLFPFPHVHLVNRILFTEDGRTPLGKPKRMHRMRRSFTKSWRNAKWRDMMLAFLHWLSKGESCLMAPVGSETEFSLRLPPVAVNAPVSIVIGDDTGEAPDSDDDLAAENDDVIDYFNPDDFDGPMGADDHGSDAGEGDAHEE